jgi:hypothetical protein
VAGRLGQDPAVTLRTYSHFVPARDKAAAEIMGGLLDGAAMKPRPARPASRRRRPTPRATA